MRIECAKGYVSTNYLSDENFFVNNVGCYKNIKTDLKSVRPNGRKDWHLIIAKRGELIVNGVSVRAENGYLFKPNVPQNYVYKAASDSEYYWIHFSGKEVENFLLKLNVNGGVVKFGENVSKVVEILNLILNAYAVKMQYADDFASGLLQSLLALTASKSSAPSPFVKATAILNDVTNDVSIKILAETYGMSEEHFIREFKNLFGCSPLQYRTKCKIRVAKNLLYETDLSIQKVSEAAGFSDYAYFSRVFTKHENVSPSNYRKFNKTFKK